MHLRMLTLRGQHISWERSCLHAAMPPLAILLWTGCGQRNPWGLDSSREGLTVHLRMLTLCTNALRHERCHSGVGLVHVRCASYEVGVVGLLPSLFPLLVFL